MDELAGELCDKAAADRCFVFELFTCLPVHMQHEHVHQCGVCLQVYEQISI